MCIAVSWPSTRVAKLSLAFKSLSCLATYPLLSPHAAAALLALAAALLALAGSLLLLCARPRLRPPAALLCALSAAAQLGWSAAAEAPRRQWQRGVGLACAAATPALLPSAELRALLEHSRTGLQLDEVLSAVAAAVEAERSRAASMRAAGVRPVGGGRALRPAQACEVYLSRAVFGSLPEMILVGHVFGAVAAQLCLLTAIKVWLEDTPTGRRWAKRLREGEEPHEKRDAKLEGCEEDSWSSAELVAIPVAIPVAVGISTRERRR
ncbi:hypothetical protein AB1Y20_017661 [Prymnesium parvum]|uniref:Uncharacterized protein n=1 Tax=Prymnesium parvum TaxID=97485 RepID=A0AB34JP39_PRYPA